MHPSFLNNLRGNSAMSGPVVSKFGGTSVVSVARILAVCAIIWANPERRVIVVSAPAGITNMLTAWVTPFGSKCLAHEITEIQREFGSPDAIIAEIRKRFIELATGLGVELNVDGMFDEIITRCSELSNDERYHFAVSRGEWINAQIVAKTLGFRFLDAARFIVLSESGDWREAVTKRFAAEIDLEQLIESGIVVGGFYGCLSYARSQIMTFPRGGSDITGAILAHLVGASVYENWTDVEGVKSADPRVVENAHKIDRMSYRELLEMTNKGAKVFHPSAIRPVMKSKTLVHVRCTMTPEIEGTLIAPTAPRRNGSITGIAHRNGLSLIKLEKAGMDEEDGFDDHLNAVLRKLRVKIHYKPMEIDSMTVIVPTDQIRGRERQLREMLRANCGVDHAEVEHGYAILCVVGAGMVHTVGIAAKIFTALANEGINVHTIDQGGSEMNISIGVADKDIERAVRAVHDAFFPQ